MRANIAFGRAIADAGVAGENACNPSVSGVLHGIPPAQLLST
jgi:hypothetical protein